MSGTQPCSVMRASPASELAGEGHGGGLDEAAERAERVIHGGGLEPAVHHAVLALLVAAPPPVILPGRGLHELLEGLRVAVLQEIAGPLPPEHVEGRVAPRRALDRKSTRLNSSHLGISYAVFCLKKKQKTN